MAAQPSPTTLTREELYEQVWSTSIFQLAKKYGLSDVGLAKVCKRHDIPRPPLGYWAKKAVGKEPRRPPLPIVVDPSLQSVRLVPTPPRTPTPVPPGDLAAPPSEAVPLTDPELAAAWAHFGEVCPTVVVPASLRSPLPLVANTLAALRRSSKEKRYVGRAESANLIWPSSDPKVATLDLSVGKDSFERAARFYDALMKAYQKCGFETEEHRDTYRCSVVLVAFRERFSLHLRELTRREPHVPTPKELAEKENWPNITRIPKWDYYPSGLLSFGLTREPNRMSTQSWADGKARRIEDMIPKIVRGVFEEVDRARARRKREADEARRQAEESRRRYEEEQRRKQEQERVDALVGEVERWETSVRIRRYLRTVERTVLKRHGQIDVGSELDKFLEWAGTVANRFDPLAPTPTSGS